MRILLIIAAFIVVAGGIIFSAQTLQTKKVQPQNPFSTAENKEPSISPRQKSSIQNMPLPQDAGVIMQFFKYVEERKIPEAVMLMGNEIISDDAVKQAWGVQLDAMKSVKVTFIDLHNYQEWSDTEHRYKVNLDVSMDPSSSSAPIPGYGWENGKNTRWITLVREDNEWKIKEIATGP